jgi:hypothetical protein
MSLDAFGELPLLTLIGTDKDMGSRFMIMEILNREYSRIITLFKGRDGICNLMELLLKKTKKMEN